MEVKLGAHVYYVVSMTTMTRNSLRHFLYSLTAEHMEVKNIISLTTTGIISLLVLGLHHSSTSSTSKFKILRIYKEAYRDRIKRKGGKIGMVYMKHG